MPTGELKVFKGIGVDLVKSKQSGHLRCRLEGLDTTIRMEVHVVDGDIPLLLSLDSQIQLGFQLDLWKKSITLRGRPLPWRRCSRGHPAVMLLRPLGSTPIGECYQMSTFKLTDQQWVDAPLMHKVLSKLHLQYNHLSVSKLVAMLKTVRGDKSIGVLSSVADDFVCHDCLKFGKAKPDPVVAKPRIATFNHQVFVDVFWVRGAMVMHMVCAFSAYRQAAVLIEKTGKAVVLALLNFWLWYLGPKKSLRIDSGSEFDSAQVQELSERYGFEPPPHTGRGGSSRPNMGPCGG